MLYDIGLRITYSYATPAAGGRHILYMTPADLPGRQRAITSLLEISPMPNERIARTDFFGNTLVEAPSAHRMTNSNSGCARAWSGQRRGMASIRLHTGRSCKGDVRHLLAGAGRIISWLRARNAEFGAYARAQLMP
jgi:hypothetical protein